MAKIIVSTIGEILTTEFLEPCKLSQNDLATAINVPAKKINDIINGTSSITADIDLRLGKYFKLSAGYFLRIQDKIELVKAKQALGKTLDKIIPIET